ncbi:ABC transporter ATP-binding protein [Actinomadura harenae]|uniref:ATP-binding cassette domain-containing protein n=1 Tax=Actinomadura harenae TaxID=2483351 RepID=A0A3M2M924_9ACTN|nr:ATP-binding cassette domain-containing protein [Actinomadura harenae]RMI43658.1 ATP-binding cassette domain-containing protein [Actinomadura harenae]
MTVASAAARTPASAIETAALGKRFGEVTALDGVDLTVPHGTVLGLLGHNGAGKSTLAGILTTLARPTSGTARVAGFDVVADAHRVRRRIGVAGQFAALDDRMTPRATLVLLARLHGLGHRAARARADGLLELFGLTEVAGRTLRACSGGTRRRLDLAAGLTGRPEVVVLDEPTAGLDPVSRLTLWEVVRGLARDGAAVLLTTQDLAEADRLADVVAVLRRGRLVASGTPGELKARVGSRSVTVRPADAADTAHADRALRANGIVAALDPARGTLTVAAASSRQVTDVLRALDTAGIDPGDLTFSEPGLDEVYLALATGHGPDAALDAAPDTAPGTAPDAAPGGPVRGAA